MLEYVTRAFEALTLFMGVTASLVAIGTALAAFAVVRGRRRELLLLTTTSLTTIASVAACAAMIIYFLLVSAPG